MTTPCVCRTEARRSRVTRCWGRQQIIEASEHRAELLAHKRAAREAKSQYRLNSAVPSFNLLRERWVDAGRKIGSMTAKVIKLLDLYGVGVFGAAARETIARPRRPRSRRHRSAL